MRRCRKLLKSSPAEISSMTVSAISTVSIVLRSRAREALPPADREDSRSAESSPLPVEEIAGTRPASSRSRHYQSLTQKRKPIHRHARSRHEADCASGQRASASKRATAAGPARRRPRRSAGFPSSARESEQAGCRPVLHGWQPLCAALPPAPPAGWRRLRQAISSMQPTAPSSTSRGVRTSLTRSSIIGRDQTSSATGLEALARWIWYCSALTSRVAASALTPGFSRATTIALVASVHAIVLWREGLRVGHPELDPRIGIGKPARQHANDGGRDGVQMNLFADDGGISGKAALEKAPGEQDYGRRLSADLRPQ